MACSARLFLFHHPDVNEKSMVRFALILLIGADRTIDWLAKVLLALLGHGLKPSAVDNFTQLGFVQLLIVVLDYGLALVGAHLCVFNALGRLEGFSNRCGAFLALHSLNLNGDSLRESRGGNHAERQNQDTADNKFSDSTSHLSFLLLCPSLAAA